MNRGRFFDQLAERYRDAALLGARVLVAILFLPSGFNKLTHFDGFAQSLAQRGLPLATLWAAPAVAIEFLGAICMLLGFQLRAVALAMAVFTVATAIIGHPFWSVDAATYSSQYINFMKNLAIMGGFLALFVAGPGRWSLDQAVSGGRQ